MFYYKISKDAYLGLICVEAEHGEETYQRLTNKGWAIQELTEEEFENEVAERGRTYIMKK